MHLKYVYVSTDYSVVITACTVVQAVVKANRMKQ